MRLLYTLTALLFYNAAIAQNGAPYWSLAGNSNASAASKLGTTTNIPLRLLTNNTEWVRLAADGKLGIGTTSPQQRLHVESSGNQAIFVNTAALGATSGSGQIGYAKALPTGGGQRLGYFLVGSRGGAQNNYNQAGMSGFAGDAWSGTSRPAYLVFETTPANATTRVERMRIDANGFVGIGTALPQFPLDVENPNEAVAIRAYNNFSGAADRTALYAISVNAPGYGYGVDARGGYRGVRGIAEGAEYAGEVVGVYGTASGSTSSGTRHGVHGYATGGVTAFGVYGEGYNASSFNAAGYFAGNVYANNYYTISDRKFKKDIAPMEKILPQVMKLKPATYQFKEEARTGMVLPDGSQLGLIADEVKAVFPQLVQKAIRPARYDEKDRTKIISPEIAYEAVNYQGLIPVLVASVQELKKETEAQQTENNELRKELAELKAMISSLRPAAAPQNAALGTATPNPANNMAAIAYTLPQERKKAYLMVTDAKGSNVRQITLGDTGSGQVSLNTALLAAGVYTYSLFVDGAKIAARQLVVVK